MVKVKKVTTIKETPVFKWWVAPVVASLVALLFAITFFISPLVIAKVRASTSPIAKASLIQTVLNKSNSVLSASVSGQDIKVPRSWLTFSPAEPVIYIAPVASSGSSGASVLGRANNKVGMYVQNSGDQIAAAAELINSNGGDWGYVLLTMNLNDRGGGTWQSLFDAAAQNHVIPIIQLFNAGSCNPDEMDFDGLAEMLNSLTWPTAHRYISIFNEVNAGDYWCGNASPSSYAKTLDKAITAFKGKSSNFFIMPAAFNSSARSGAVSNEGAKYIGEDAFLAGMNEAAPGIFNRIDGWANHAYPQPNFSGAIYGGRDSILNYRWELSLLSNYGAGGLPVFITETGWIHREGQESCSQYSQSGLLSAETVSARYREAFVNYWLPDARVTAIAPFIFASNDPCAAGFTWQKADGGWYPQAEMLMSIPKTAGNPN